MFSVELSSHFRANCNKNIVEVHEQSPDFPGWNTALVHQIRPSESGPSCNICIISSPAEFDPSPNNNHWDFQQLSDAITV